MWHGAQEPRVSRAGNNRIIPSLTRRQIPHKPDGAGSSRRQDRFETADFAGICLPGMQKLIRLLPDKNNNADDRASRTHTQLTEKRAAGASGTGRVCAKANAV